MTASLIDGKARAARLRNDVASAVALLRGEHGLKPGLAVVLVGEDPASKVYVSNKVRQTEECGMRSIEHQAAGRNNAGRASRPRGKAQCR